MICAPSAGMVADLGTGPRRRGARFRRGWTVLRWRVVAYDVLDGSRPRGRFGPLNYSLCCSGGMPLAKIIWREVRPVAADGGASVPKPTSKDTCKACETVSTPIPSPPRARRRIVGPTEGARRLSVCSRPLAPQWTPVSRARSAEPGRCMSARRDDTKPAYAQAKQKLKSKFPAICPKHIGLAVKMAKV